MGMKTRLIAIGSIFVVLALSISGCQESSENENDHESSFSNYENTEKSFIIEYPKTWNKYENPPEVPDVDVLFTSQSNEPTKTGSLMITVIYNISMTMDEFKEAHIENLSILIPDFDIVSEKNTTLSNLTGYELIFTFTNDIYTWRQLEVWTIHENTLNLIVHQADQAYYESFTDDVEHMIRSFQT